LEDDTNLPRHNSGTDRSRAELSESEVLRDGREEQLEGSNKLNSLTLVVEVPTKTFGVYSRTRAKYGEEATELPLHRWCRSDDVTCTILARFQKGDCSFLHQGSGVMGEARETS